MSRRRPPPTIVAQIATGTVEIEPDPDRPGGHLLLIDGAQQSYVDMSDPTHLEFEYVRSIGHVLDLRPPGPVRALHLGGGGLTLARYLGATRPHSSSTVVELDAQLVDLVRMHLPWGDGIRVRIGDARAAVAAARPGSTDVVISDVFAQARTPGPMTTVEFLTLARDLLRPGGHFVANLADQSPFTYARRYLAGIRATFPQTLVMADPAVWRGRRFGNFVAVAGPVDAAELGARSRRDPWPARVVAGAELASFCSGAQPYTDADAPGSPPPPPGIFSPVSRKP